MSSTTQATRQSRTIACTQAPQSAYLEVSWQKTDGLPPRLKVMPTELGRKALNQFWPLWLKQMILAKTHRKDLYAVEIFGKYVLVSSGATSQALVATVLGIAQSVRPLNELLALRINEGPKDGVEWRVSSRPGYVPIALLAGAVRVPEGFKLTVIDDSSYVSSDVFLGWLAAGFCPEDEVSTVTLRARRRDRRGGMSLREARLVVELQFALAAT